MYVTSVSKIFMASHFIDVCDRSSFINLQKICMKEIAYWSERKRPAPFEQFCVPIIGKDLFTRFVDAGRHGHMLQSFDTTVFMLYYCNTLHRLHFQYML